MKISLLLPLTFFSGELLLAGSGHAQQTNGSNVTDLNQRRLERQQREAAKAITGDPAPKLDSNRAPLYHNDIVRLKDEAPDSPRRFGIIKDRWPNAVVVEFPGRERAAIPSTQVEGTLSSYRGFHVGDEIRVANGKRGWVAAVFPDGEMWAATNSPTRMQWFIDGGFRAPAGTYQKAIGVMASTGAFLKKLFGWTKKFAFGVGTGVVAELSFGTKGLKAGTAGGEYMGSKEALERYFALDPEKQDQILKEDMDFKNYLEKLEAEALKKLAPITVSSCEPPKFKVSQPQLGPRGNNIEGTLKVSSDGTVTGFLINDLRTGSTVDLSLTPDQFGRATHKYGGGVLGPREIVRETTLEEMNKQAISSGTSTEIRTAVITTSKTAESLLGNFAAISAKCPNLKSPTTTSAAPAGKQESANSVR